MPAALLLLIEQLVLSPTVQAGAWQLLRPYVERGITPSDDVLQAAQLMADRAHINAQGTA